MAKRILSLIIGHNGAINALKFSPDGRYLITASDDTAIQVKTSFLFVKKIYIYKLN
jgi:katanin p80 WD40 repeat-containing subunit B1